MRDGLGKAEQDEGPARGFQRIGARLKARMPRYLATS